MRIGGLILIATLIRYLPARAVEPPTQPAGKLPFITVDAKTKRILVECEAIGCQNPLEFFCVVSGTSEHEAILRTKAKPSNIHLALLMMGLEPGEPVKYSETAKKWFPPHGPPLNISCEFVKDGKTLKVPAYRMLRDLHTKKIMPPMTWIFAGSRTMPDGVYAADATGYVISTVNFELTLIDIPALASSANETLEWIANADEVPKAGTAVAMIIEPAGNVVSPPEAATTAPSTQPREGAAAPVGGVVDPAPASATPAAETRHRLSDVAVDQDKVDRMHKLWNDKVAPHSAALREAAQAHYEAIAQLRREQQRLIDEADRIQRLIDELEQKYQNMTTPHPEPVDK